jgi:hypothetical protein
MWCCTSTPPHSFTAWCLIKHRANFTFYFSLFFLMYTALHDYVISTWQISLSQMPRLHTSGSHVSRRYYSHTYGPHLLTSRCQFSLSCKAYPSSAELRAMNSSFIVKVEYVVSLISFFFTIRWCCRFLRPVFGFRLITDSCQVAVQSVPLPLDTAPLLTC